MPHTVTTSPLVAMSSGDGVAAAVGVTGLGVTEGETSQHEPYRGLQFHTEQYAAVEPHQPYRLQHTPGGQGTPLLAGPHCASGMELAGDGVLVAEASATTVKGDGDTGPPGLVGEGVRDARDVESVSVTLTESDTLAVGLAESDTVAVILADSEFDTFAVGLAEFDTVAVILVDSEFDTLAVGLVESDTVAVILADLEFDTLAVGLAESDTLAVELTESDTVAVILADVEPVLLAVVVKELLGDVLGDQLPVEDIVSLTVGVRLCVSVYEIDGV